MHQSKAQSINQTQEKEFCKYNIILYITTVSDIYYSFHFIWVFNPENPKQCFFYKQEFKKQSSGMSTALFSIQAKL